jgi:hypothetical protein
MPLGHRHTAHQSIRLTLVAAAFLSVNCFGVVSSHAGSRFLALRIARILISGSGIGRLVYHDAAALVCAYPFVPFGSLSEQLMQYDVLNSSTSASVSVDEVLDSQPIVKHTHDLSGSDA